MPTRVLLEGPAIEPLLAQVRDEYGSGVRIISADKVRSGGFGGFFAKQHYELSVEVPDSFDDSTLAKPDPAPPPQTRDEPQTLEQLLERAESHDRITADQPSAYERPAPSPAPSALSAPFPPPARSGPKQIGREAGIEDTDDAVAATHRELSESAAAFAELMAGLDAANHIATSRPVRPSPRPEAADDRERTPTVRPFRPATATGSPVNSGVKPLAPMPSLGDLMGGLGISHTDLPPFEPAEAPPPPLVRSAAATYGLNPPSPPAPSVEPPGPAGLPLHTDPVVGNLISVGMPEAMAHQITGGDTYAGACQWSAMAGPVGYL